MATSPNEPVKFPSKFARKTQLAKRAANGEAKADGEVKEKPPLQTKVDTERLIAQMEKEINSRDPDTRREAMRIMKATAAMAAKRVCLFVWGYQPTSQPQVNMAAIAVLKANRIVPVGAGDAHAPGDADVPNDTAEILEP